MCRRGRLILALVTITPEYCPGSGTYGSPDTSYLPCKATRWFAALTVGLR